MLSSKTTHIIQSTDQTRAQASTFTGESTVVMAGRDANVKGSNVGAQKDLVLSAGREVNILPGENTSQDYDYKRVKKSGLGAMGGLSIGTRRQTDSVDGKQVFHTASTVGSVEGNVLIKAGNGLNVVGSNVIARQGDVTLIGQQVNIVAALDTARSKEFHEIKQSGLSVTASNPVVSAVQTGERMASAASKVDNPVMRGLAAGTAGLAAYNAYDAVQKMGSLDKATSLDKVGGVSVQISLGSSKSTSTTERNASSAAGSTVAAGGPDHHRPGRGPELGHHRHGFEPVGRRQRRTQGRRRRPAAGGAQRLRTEDRQQEQQRQYRRGLQRGQCEHGRHAGAGRFGQPGQGRRQDESWTNSHVVAGNTLAFQSGGDTTLKGASGKADQIIASVGGNLLLESLQDTSKYDAKNQSAGFGASICLTGTCVSSVSANAGQGQMKSDFKSVTEQTGLWGQWRFPDRREEQHHADRQRHRQQRQGGSRRAEQAEHRHAGDGGRQEQGQLQRLSGFGGRRHRVGWRR